MALQVTEHTGLSDVGRQREANEDNWVIAPPFYVVADGMGGARAGEVASRLAAETFQRAGADDSGTAEEVLERRAQEANAAIFGLAERDESRRGMGTTLTAALVQGADVSIGHVGDSRAYRLRDGTLEQLTHDHSLVAELLRSGQITAEAAEVHPQRSIITRALGPEPTVEVDTHTHRAQAGDIYLLCSDGLTGMISDGDVERILRSSTDLEAAAEALILAANQSGGKDNITAVLFRIGEGDGPVPPPEEHTLSGAETIHQGLTADDVQAAVAEQERAGAIRREAPQPREPVTAAVASRHRRWPGIVIGLVVAALVVAGGYIGLRQAYFVGTNDQGLITLYRGLPYELPLGIDLYSEQAVSGVPARSLPKAQRTRILDHEWRSKGDAQDLVRQLESGTLDPQTDQSRR